MEISEYAPTDPYDENLKFVVLTGASFYSKWVVSHLFKWAAARKIGADHDQSQF